MARNSDNVQELSGFIGQVKHGGGGRACGFTGEEWGRGRGVDCGGEGRGVVERGDVKWWRGEGKEVKHRGASLVSLGRRKRNTTDIGHHLNKQSSQGIFQKFSYWTSIRREFFSPKPLVRSGVCFPFQFFKEDTPSESTTSV